MRRLLKIGGSAVFLLSIAYCAVGMKRLEYMTGSIERDFEPFIAAMERFRSEKGAYPAKLEQLVPRHLSSLPLCPPRQYQLAMPIEFPSSEEINYIRRSDSSYAVGCSLGVMVFPQDAYYESSERRWSILD